MGILEFLHQFVADYTTRTIGLGTAVMGIVCGMLGSFAVLRRQSLLGDAISHAALPGIALAFLLTGVKNPLIFFIGAAVSGIIATIWVMNITGKTHLKQDTALGIVLSVFFGFGILLLTMIQKMPNANQAGLDKFLFGQAATLMVKDVWLMLVVGLFTLVLLFLFWKEFKILSFDPHYAKTLGLNISLLDILLTSLIVVAIVLGLQTVGVVLMSAMLLAPAAAARQWTNKLGLMIVLASAFGAFAGLSGTIISASASNISTGPVIVLSAVLLVFVSFAFAPGRGLLSREIRYRRNRKDLRLNKTLALMYETVSEHEKFTHPHSVGILNNFQGFDRKCLRELESRNLIVLNNGTWSLTPEGYKQAENFYNEISNSNHDNGSN
jgi:manganese/zinc/iron transport system permease protein